VRGVRDEPALRADRAFERGQHRVEARRQSAELVAATYINTFAQVAGRRDALGRGGQAPHGAERGCRDEGCERSGQGDADSADEDDPEANPPQGVLRGRQRIDREDSSTARPGKGCDEFAPPDVLDPRVHVVAGGCGIRHRDSARRDRNRKLARPIAVRVDRLGPVVAAAKWATTTRRGLHDEASDRAGRRARAWRPARPRVTLPRPSPRSRLL